MSASVRTVAGAREAPPSAVGRGIASLRRGWSDAGAARPPAYVLIVATVAVLNIIGCVMVLSASSVASLTNYGSAWYFFQRQVLWTVLGVIVFVIVSRIDYHALRKLVVPLLIASFVGLALVLVPGLGVEVAGARRWLGSGQFRFQPTEIAKLGVLVYGADLLTRREDVLNDWRRVIRPLGLVFGAMAFLMLMQPDLDSTVVLGLIALTLLVVGGIRMRHLAVLGTLTVTATALLAIAAPYRRARVLTFLDPWGDPTNTGYQLTQSLIALGSGGWTGVGLGAGRAKWMFLPNALTDFVFAVIGEVVCLVGCTIVVALFLAFAVLGTRVALRAPDRFGTLLAAGVTVWVVGQAAINIGGVTSILPVSGITLPFVSFGGSALLFTMAGAGILASVARQAR